MRSPNAISFLLIMAAPLACSRTRVRTAAPFYDQSPASDAQVGFTTNQPFWREFREMPSDRSFLQDFAKRIVKDVNLTQFRQWAVELLVTHAGTSRNISDGIPADVRGLQPGLNPIASTELNVNRGERVVWVDWGGGWKHWGIAYAPSGAALSAWRVRTEIVTNEIYVYLSTDQ